MVGDRYRRGAISIGEREGRSAGESKRYVGKRSARADRATARHCSSRPRVDRHIHRCAEACASTLAIAQRCNGVSTGRGRRNIEGIARVVGYRDR